MSTELVPAVAFTPTGLKIPDSFTYEQWEAVGAQLHDIEQARQWWVGDWVNYGEARYGEKYAQALDATGLTYATLQDYSYVARQVPMSLRNDIVSWSHHKAVAALEPADQQVWLDRIAAEGLSVAATRLALKAPADDEPAQGYPFVTTLRVLHTASDVPHADAWVRRLITRLTEQGATVTTHETKAR